MSNNHSEYLRKLAAFIASFKTIPLDNELLSHTAMTLADTYGTAFSGVQTKAFYTAFESAENLFGDGKYEVWGTEKKLSLLGSVFYNTLSISSTDFDDGHRQAVGHPASAVTAVALVLGTEKKLGIIEILKSVIIGYEVATRFSLARKPENINSYSSGRWAAFGTTATAAYILNLKEDEIIQALSNAYVLSPHMLGGSSDVNTGSMSKEGVAWAVQSGLQSAMFAKNGFSGPYLFLEESNEFDPEKIVHELGRSYLISSNYFKPYACCRWLHPSLSACFKIISENKIETKTISKVRIFSFERIQNLISEKYPTNIIMAQFHLPFAMAIMLNYKQCGPEYFNDNYIKKDELKTLIDKIEIIPSEKYTNLFPSQLSSAVEIECGSKKHFKEELSAPWDYGNHPQREELKEKFDMQTSGLNHIDWEWFFSF